MRYYGKHKLTTMGKISLQESMLFTGHGKLGYCKLFEWPPNHSRLRGTLDDDLDLQPEGLVLLLFALMVIIGSVAKSSPFFRMEDLPLAALQQTINQQGQRGQGTSGGKTLSWEKPFKLWVPLQ